MSKLFISGGTVIDPETLRRFRADVLCDGEKIEAIFPGGCDAPCGVQTLDAAGCFVCPGFIDPHGHIDGCKHTGTLSLLQGITTSVGGNCGFSPLNTASFLHAQTQFPIHQAELVGLCALREAAGVTNPFEPATRAQAQMTFATKRCAAARQAFPLDPATRPARRLRRWKPSVPAPVRTADPPPSTRACTP